MQVEQDISGGQYAGDAQQVPPPHAMFVCLHLGIGRPWWRAHFEDVIVGRRWSKCSAMRF